MFIKVTRKDSGATCFVNTDNINILEDASNSRAIITFNNGADELKIKESSETIASKANAFKRRLHGQG